MNSSGVRGSPASGQFVQQSRANFNDTIYGDGDANMLDGNRGNDVLFGGLGEYVLVAGRGSDFANGGDSEDLLYGNEGADTLFGGARVAQACEGQQMIWGTDQRKLLTPD